MRIQDQCMTGHFSRIETAIKCEAKKLLRNKANALIQYEDLYQSGWVGAMRALKSRKGDLALNYIRKAAHGEMLRFIFRCGIFSRCKTATYGELTYAGGGVEHDSELLDSLVDTRQNFGGWSTLLGTAIECLGVSQRKAIELCYIGGSESSSVVERELGNMRNFRECHRGAISSLRKQLLRGGLEA